MRFYTRDSAACRKDLDLFRLIHPRIPIPAIYFADPDATHFHTSSATLSGLRASHCAILFCAAMSQRAGRRPMRLGQYAVR